MKLARNGKSGKLEAHHAMIQVLEVSDLLKCPVVSWSSATEEVNAAVFHPLVGGGLAFATPQGTVGFTSVGFRGSATRVAVEMLNTSRDIGDSISDTSKVIGQ